MFSLGILTGSSDPGRLPFPATQLGRTCTHAYGPRTGLPEEVAGCDCVGGTLKAGWGKEFLAAGRFTARNDFKTLPKPPGSRSRATNPVGTAGGPSYSAFGRPSASTWGVSSPGVKFSPSAVGGASGVGSDCS